MDIDLENGIFCKVFTCPVYHDNRCCTDCNKPCEDMCLNGPERCNITTDLYQSEYELGLDDDDDFED